MKNFIFISALLVTITINAQTTSFDNLNANPLTGKAISWTSSNYGSGFGHRIINSDPGGQTLLNFQGRHNSSTWTDLMSITSSGKVGIGTTYPNSLLELKSLGKTELTISGDGAGATNAGLVLKAYHSTNYRSLGTFMYDVGGQNEWFAGRPYGGSDKFVIYRRENITNHDVLTSSLSHNSGNSITKSLFALDKNGNLGIGTDNPQAKLEVSAANSGDAILRIEADEDNNNEADNPLIQFRQDGGQLGINLGFSEENFGGNIFGIGTRYSGQESWDTFVVNPQNGNIGIGTNSPDAKLTVKGNIHTQEVKVDLNGAVAPDYVFLKNYKLKSINEVETYIKNKGHLPNIPSAVEMEENGIELKQMNLKLLEKIEELTLYTIAQEKKLKEQQKNIKAQKTINDQLITNNQNLEARLAKIEALLTTK